MVLFVKVRRAVASSSINFVVVVLVGSEFWDITPESGVVAVCESHKGRSCFEHKFWCKSISE